MLDFYFVLYRKHVTTGDIMFFLEKLYEPVTEEVIGHSEVNKN
jgi:hypothetical protein